MCAWRGAWSLSLNNHGRFDLRTVNMKWTYIFGEADGFHLVIGQKQAVQKRTDFLFSRFRCCVFVVTPLSTLLTCNTILIYSFTNTSNAVILGQNKMAFDFTRHSGRLDNDTSSKCDAQWHALWRADQQHHVGWVHANADWILVLHTTPLEIATVVPFPKR